MFEAINGYMNGLYQSPDNIHCIGHQLESVLKNCDEISYEEAGTAEAYALLHFLDRYHRFQLVFENLDSLGLMPAKKKEYPVDVLDVGTGPGPSMYALSDFFSSKGESGFNIDYVEKSKQFRN